MTTPLSRRDLVRAALLALLTALAWLYPASMWRPTAWRAPSAYEIDALETMGRIRVTGELGVAAFADRTVARLGAPFGADWSHYPMPDVPVFLLLAKVADAVGLVAAGHLAMLFAHELAVLVFFFCSRALGHRPLFAGGAALLFGLSHFIQFRNLGHYSFALAFVVPAILLAAWLIGAGTTVLQRTRWQIFCVATGAVTGTANPYFGLVWVTLVLCALARQVLTERRSRNLLTGASSLGAFAATFIVVHWSALTAVLSDDSVLVRTYANAEALALRPLELLIPPHYHPVPPVARMAKTYGSLTGLKDEVFAPYLGVIGCLGLVVVALGSLRFRRRGVLRPAHAAVLLALLLFAIPGGLGSALVLTVTDVFRAGNRYSVVVLAVVLLALAAWASRRWRTAPAAVVWVSTALIVSAGFWEQSLPPASEAQQVARSAPVDVDRSAGAELERLLPAGSMVFQLPVVPFLEQKPVGKMTDYQLLRPFLFTRTLRFSYGHLANAPALPWMRRVARLPASRFVAELQAAGFAAIHLHRAAFADGGDALVRELEQAGAQPLLDAPPHRFLRLQPAATPTLPVLVGPNRYDPWDEAWAEGGAPTLLVVQGFEHLESDERARWRWAGHRATAVLWNPAATARRVRLRFRHWSLAGGELVLSVAGQEAWRAVVKPQAANAELELDAAPGETRLQWDYSGILLRASKIDSRQLGFSIQVLALE